MVSRLRSGVVLAVLILGTYLAVPASGQTFTAQIQNLVNQIRVGAVVLGRLRAGAGTGTGTYHVTGTLFWENPAVSTTAGTTTFVTGTPYPIPANTLATNGDRLNLDIEVDIPTAAATDVKNVTCAVGYTSFNTATGGWTGGFNNIIESTASNAGQIHFHILAELTRLGPTSTGGRWYSWWESGAANTITTQSAGWATSSAVTWANANNLLCAVGNTTGGNTQVLTLQEWRISLDPR